MKAYIAIGHFKENKNATICIAFKQNTKKDFYNDCLGNEFVPYVILTEKKLRSFENLDSFYLFDEVKKLTSNYRKWNLITEFIEQCYDIMIEKISNAN